MKKFISFGIICLHVYFLVGQTKNKYPDIDIPYTKYVLGNGLTLILHEDHKAPIIAFNIWYHVGSKNEKPGKTGFAHLFEHLMFSGSEHNNVEYFNFLKALGATNRNGTTWSDRTNYFENFPVSALDQILWAESDRMGFMVNVIDSSKLNLQRGVVQNEKRQGENQPYGLSEELTLANSYPYGHPYSWTTIGSMDDLNAASLDDVKNWFKNYYGPNNAVICIAGDLNPTEVFEKVKKYFGNIPAGPPTVKQASWVAKMSGTHFQIAQDRVPQARLQKTWNIPGWGTREITYLNLLCDILANGKTSRLYKRLVYDEQIATKVECFTGDQEIGGQFFIQVDAKPGVDLSKINKIVDEELQKVLVASITNDELDRAKTLYFSQFINGMQRIGGFGGKSDILAQNATFGGSPDYYKQVQTWIKAASSEDIKEVADTWLADGQYVLEILPYGDFTFAKDSLNRNLQPALGPTPQVKFPPVKEFKLSNGLAVALVERHSAPIVNLEIMVNAGFAADKFAFPGVAATTGKMLTEGTTTRTALQISDQQQEQGATLQYFSDLDNAYMGLNALKSNFDASLNLFCDVLLNPSFPEKNFERVKQEEVLAIAQEESSPNSMGFRLLPVLLYGKSHPYGNSNPWTGLGTQDEVKNLTRDDLIKFHDTWFVPNNAVLVVVGDISEEELKSKLEAKLGAWKSKPVPVKHFEEVKYPQKPEIYLLDKPGSLQSIILAAEISPSAKDSNFESINMMNRIIGGNFSSRINMNLRENKHWSYGSRSAVISTKGPGIFFVSAPVQTDKTKESMFEIQQELTQFVSSRPVTDTEFEKEKSAAILELPGSWETNLFIMYRLEDNITYERGNDYLNNYNSMFQNLTLSEVQKSAAKVIKPGNLTWVIVGDRAKIANGIQELNFGTVKFLDVYGNEIK
jgi:zinc protease